MAPTTISELENGHHVPRRSTVKLLAAALDWDRPEELFSPADPGAEADGTD